MAYGAPGVGKTTLFGSAVDVPQMRDVILISAEKGELSIMDSDRVKNGVLLDRITISSFKQLKDISDFLAAHAIYRERNDLEALKKLQTQVGLSEDRVRQYRTVIVDSLSEIESFNMYELLGITVEGSLVGDMPVAEFKEYKQNFNKMQLLIRKLRDLPMHVLMTCARQYEQDETKKYHFTPALTGKLSNQIQGFFDIVGYLDMAQPTEEKAAPRRLWVQPVGGKFDAKTRRSNVKSAYFDDPTMISIMRQAGLLKPEEEKKGA